MKWAIEYWVVYEDGDLVVLEGKEWRRWKDFIDTDLDGVKVIYIERVRTEYDEFSTYDREHETLWELNE